MKATYKRLTYKTLFSYSLVVIALLMVAVPVVAANRSGGNLLAFSNKSTTGQTPQAGQALARGLNVDHLEPGGEKWYTFDQQSLNEPELSWVSLALRYESEALIDVAQANFEVYEAQPGTWFTQASPQTKLGNGLSSPLQTASPNLQETFWSGQVEQQLYYVRMFNTSPFGLDYTLEVKADVPAVTGTTPASFGSAALGPGEALTARQMAWTLTAQAVENMSAEQATIWMKQAQAVGWLVTEATPVEEIPRPAGADPQLLWTLTAQAIAGLDAEASAQWLIQADSLGWLAIPLANISNSPAATSTSGNTASSAEALVPVEPETAYSPINIYPNNPLPFNFNAMNSGRLLPYGEHWYAFSRDDLDKELVENMKLTMFFTPRKGFISDRINFEIFTGSQYDIWQRGDADYMSHLGLGMWVSRDEDPDTGERLWSGTLVDGDQYLIKVKNGTPDVVDYYLFPNDVENAELGNPTFYKSEAATGYVPYAISPPTRPEFIR